MYGALILPDEDTDPAQAWDDATALQLAEQCDWSQFPACEVAVAGARTLTSFGDTGRPELLALAISLLEDAHERAESLPAADRADTALCLGEALREGSVVFDEPDWLPEAIAAGETAVRLTSDAWAWVALCETYRAAFRATGIKGHLTDALRCARTAVDLADPADAAVVASNLGAVTTHAAPHLDDPQLLDEAYEAATTAVRQARRRDPYLPVYLANLARTQDSIAERDASAAVARRAARSATRAMLKEPTSVSALLVSAQCLETLARLTRSDATFDDAAKVLGRADAAARGTPRQPEILLARSRLAQQRFELTDEPELLVEATRLAQRAVALQGGQTAATAHALLNLAVCRTRACERGLTAPRTRATQLVSRALNRASPSERLELVGDAGLVWLSHYERTRARRSLRAAIQLLREAASKPRTPSRIWSNLAGALLLAFDSDPSEALVHEATDAARHACAAAPMGNGQIVSEAVLASCLEASFRISHDPLDLRQSADCARRAARLLGATSPDAAAIRTNCAVALRTSYEHNGRLADLTLAVQLLNDAVLAATPSSLPTCLGQLAATLRTRFEATGNRADLRRALETVITLQSCGLTITKAGSATISACWLTAYETSGDKDQLDAAVGWARTALTRRTRTSDVHAAALTTLANALLSRFELTGEEQDLKEALLRNRQAIRATPPGEGQSAASRYANLANVLRVRASLGFGRTTTALHAAETAVRLAGPKDPHLPAYLSGVALVLSELGRHKEASRVLRQAVKACPRASSDRLLYRTNLAASLRDEFTAGGSRRELAEAIRILQLLPTAEAPWALLAHTILGDCLHARNAPSDLQAALNCWTSVRDDEKAPTWLRLIAAVSAAESAAEDISDWGLAADSYRRAVELQVQAAWHGLAWASRRRFLAARPNMGADAAATTLQAATHGGTALTLLEAGRDIVWRGRTERRNTRQDHPLLARMCQVADELDALDRSTQASAAARLP